MARVVVLGAGISGHTAALHLRRVLGTEHEVVVVSPNADWNWIPSNIWVGVGRMDAAQVTFPLAPVYRRAGDRHSARPGRSRSGRRATASTGQPAVDIDYTVPGRAGERERLSYDYLINATGPEAELRRDPRARPGRQLALGMHRPGTPQQAAQALDEVDRAAAARASGRPWSSGWATGPAPARARRSSTRSTSSTSCARRGLRDLRRRHLPDQRARARRLRRRRDDVRAERLPDLRARSGPSRCSASAGSRRSSARTSSGSSRARSTTRRSTAAGHARTSTSPCCCRRSGART